MTLFTDDRDSGNSSSGGSNSGGSNSGGKTVTIEVDGHPLEIPEYSNVEEILKTVGKDPNNYGLVKGTNTGGSDVVPKSSNRIQLKEGDRFVTDMSNKGG